jgi:hypothetical protein
MCDPLLFNDDSVYLACWLVLHFLRSLNNCDKLIQMNHFLDIQGYSDQGNGLLVIGHSGHVNDDGRKQLETLFSFPHDHSG